MNRKRLLFRVSAVAAAAAMAVFSLPSGAQDAARYPEKAVRIVVPFTAGGSSDLLARMIAEKLTASLGQPFIVENRPGAAAVIGTSHVAKAPPDGYTLLVATSGAIVYNPAIYSRLPYAPEKDLAAVSMLCSYPLMLIVPPDGPNKSLRELVAFSKAHPDRSNYAAAAASIQLATELLKSKLGIRAERVSYKGGADANNSVMAGEVSMYLADSATASSLVKGQRVRALAVTSGRRMAEFPDVPTLKEEGVDLEMKIWIGLFAPGGTPAAIVDRLQAEVARIIRLPDIQARMAGMSIIPEGGGSADLARTVAAEIRLWTEVAQANDIRAD